MRSEFNTKMPCVEEDVQKLANENLEQMKERVTSLWMVVCAITDRGNNAEVRRKKDGSLTVYEVKKNIVTL